MDQSLKQRLVGALVFISLAIIFLPIIFDGQRTEIDTAPYKAPPKPELKTQTLDLKSVEDSAQTVVEELDQVVEQDREVEAIVNDETVEQFIEAEQKVDGEINQSPDQAIKLADAWIIQVGAFKTDENANQFRDKLLAAGYNAYTYEVNGYSKVYVGPEIRKYRLTKLKKQLEQEFDVKALILKYIP